MSYYLDDTGIGPGTLAEWAASCAEHARHAVRMGMVNDAGIRARDAAHYGRLALERCEQEWQRTMMLSFYRA